MSRIILVGHCGPDTSYLVMAAKKAVPDAEVIRAGSDRQLQSALPEGSDGDGANGGGGGTLLLVNRVLDGSFDDSGGIELIARLRQSHPQVRSMLVSNYDDAQSAAVQAGALPGFGKREIGSAKVLDLIRGAVQPVGSRQ